MFLQARVTAADLHDIDLEPYVARDGREYIVLEIKGSAWSSSAQTLESTAAKFRKARQVASPTFERPCSTILALWI